MPFSPGASVVSASLVALESGGQAGALKLHDGALNVNVHSPVTSFGEILTAQHTAVFQTIFPYGIDPIELITGSSGYGGAAGAGLSSSLGVASLYSGTGTVSYANIRSRRSLSYKAGQGAITRFSALYDNPLPQTYQLIGLGTVENGFFIGYSTGSGFGIIHRYGGRREIRKLTITSPSTTNETAYIVLEGVSASYSTRNNNSLIQTSNEIASGNYAGTALGWDAFALDSNVYFISKRALENSGKFEVVATTATGTFSYVGVGTSSTDIWISQSQWNVDKLDGTGVSGINLNPQKGNVFQIQMQYLGFGNIEFSVIDPTTSDFRIFHKIHHANQAVRPSVDNPILPISYSSVNVLPDNGPGVTLKTASGAAFIQGQIRRLGNRRGHTNAKSSIGTTFTSILCIRNSLMYKEKQNLAELLITNISVAADGTKPADFVLLFNPTLSGIPNWTQIDANTSIAEYDTSATTATGGIQKMAFTVNKSGDLAQSIQDLELFLQPGEFVCVAARASAGSTDVNVALTWIEDK